LQLYGFVGQPRNHIPDVGKCSIRAITALSRFIFPVSRVDLLYKVFFADAHRQAISSFVLRVG
jgi:hypothetical protein